MKEFFNILQKINIPKQQINGGVVEVKKRGRPKMPNKKYYHFRLDIGLHQKLKAWAKKNHMSESPAVALAISRLIDN